MYSIENEFLYAEFVAKGAEQKSLKDKRDGSEYLWQGDPNYWGKTAPVLFPFIGMVKEGQYDYLGESYEMSKHGFARDYDFSVSAHSEEMIEFSLKWNEEIFPIYPFMFEFRIKYTLIDKALKTEYVVKNFSDTLMYFSVGGHPAFNFDWLKNPCFIEFDETERLFTKEINLDNGLIKDTFRDMGYKKSLKLKSQDFEKDALIFKDLSSKSLVLTDIIDDKSIRFTFDGFRYLAFWSPLAPFVCLEPWCGIADYENHNGQLVQKTGIEVLKTDEVFERAFTIEVI